jgi:hypothetical protein
MSLKEMANVLVVVLDVVVGVAGPEDYSRLLPHKSLDRVLMLLRENGETFCV